MNNTFLLDGEEVPFASGQTVMQAATTAGKYMANKTKSYKVDFYYIEQEGFPNTSSVRDLLSKHVGGHAPAFSINDPNIQFQIRSISLASKNSNTYKAVFGRLRHNHTPEQASTTGNDVDVQLIPGHGLVEKNHFLFFSDINLIVFQRCKHAGQNTHLQAYLNQPNYAKISLTQILTTDCYRKIIEGQPLKKVEISIRKPAGTLPQEDNFLKPLVDRFQGYEPGHMKLSFSATKGQKLPDFLKDSLVKLSKFGRTSVARATLIDDTAIDLLLDRLVGKFTVNLQDNGRPLPSDIFTGLASAKDECADDLKNFFHS